MHVPRGWWRVVAMTYETSDGGASWVPVVRHEMYGPTRARALEVFQAHLESDAFLRGCTMHQRYAGIVCRTETHVEQL